MKTYIFNAINRYKRFSENLEVQSAICNKSWWVFNDSGEKELYIFQEDGTLYITLNGKVTNGTWKYISANKSLIIGTESQSYMLHLLMLHFLHYKWMEQKNVRSWSMKQTSKPIFHKLILTLWDIFS